MKDTIAALSTPFGESGIAVIRISGPKSLEIAKAIFEPKNKKDISSLKPYQMYYGHLIEPDTKEKYDDIMFVFMKEPHSYTGENMVEFHTHGSMVIVQKTLEYIFSLGARPAEPGEFTRRAFLNGKIDLLQAESIQNMISAKTIQSQKAVYKVLSGKLSSIINNMIRKIKDIHLKLFVNIDFPEEELPEFSPEDFTDDVKKIIEFIDNLLSTYEMGKLLKEGLKISIIGPTNVGKSSLFNTLLVEDRAIVTDIEGTTRDVIKERINIKGIPVILMDTAGIRKTSDKIEKIGIELTKKAIEESELCLLVLDATKEKEIPQDFKNVLKNKKFILVINKIDLINSSEKENWKKHYPNSILISSITKEGIRELNEAIYNFAILKKPCFDIYISSIRHKILLEKAKKHLIDFIKGAKANLFEDLLLVDLQSAMEYLQELTGKITTDDILDEIFKEFCIGK